MEDPPIFSVYQITSGIQNLLGVVYSDVRVSGEVTNLTVSGPGHCYFSLKDESAQISAVLWSRFRTKGSPELRDGMEVVCRGRIEVYPPRGSYQIIVSEIEEVGVGSLEQAFVQLKNRLAAEGLFDITHKKSLPRRIQKVGVVTSSDGAAIRDFLQVLRRRWSALDVCIYPAPVQGKGAAAKLAAGVDFFNKFAGRLKIDVIVLTRGGGSMEDLWEFNEEVLLRAVYASELPVISAVGHEIDVTLCDLVADRRALTPSEAAEILSPNAADIRSRLSQNARRLQNGISNILLTYESQVENLGNSPALRFPFRKISEFAQNLDLIENRIKSRVTNNLEHAEQQIAAGAAHLQSLSPLGVLARGYSLTQMGGGQVVRNVVQLQVGDELRTRFAQGVARSTVTKIEKEDENGNVDFRSTD